MAFVLYFEYLVIFRFENFFEQSYLVGVQMPLPYFYFRKGTSCYITALKLQKCRYLFLRKTSTFS